MIWFDFALDKKVAMEDLRRGLAILADRPLNSVKILFDITEIDRGDVVNCQICAEAEGDFFQRSSIYLDTLPTDLSILDAASGLARLLQRTVFVGNDDEPSNPWAFIKVPPEGVAVKIYVDPEELDYHDRYVILESKVS